MSRYSAPRCGYSIDGDHIVTDGTVRNKVSGTSMGGILKVSPWSTPFQVACNLLGLAREDISNKPAVITGQVLEPVVIAYADKTYSDYGMFVPAEKIFEKRTGDHDSWVSDFEDDVFSGHVDGAVINERDGKTYILEIKTSANLKSWEDGVPEYYYWQVALYNEFIAKESKAYVVLGMVDDATYSNPLCWVPNERTVALFPLEIDRESVREKLDEVRAWYAEYIVKGITPDYDPSNPKDVEMFEHLRNLASSIEDMESKVARLGEVDALISDAEASGQALYEEQRLLKEQLKEYMLAHDLSAMGRDTDPLTVKLQMTKKKQIDPSLMMLDGIDPSKYTVSSETPSIRTVKNRM